MSKQQARFWSSEFPVGDPFGGVAYGERNDPLTVGIASVAGSLLSSNSASDAAETAARASGDASNASIAEQRRQYDLNRADMAPYIAAGTGAVNRLAAGFGTGGEFNQNFSNADFLANRDPGYQFSMDEGMKALNASMAAKGLGTSGAGIKGALAYGTGLGSREYQNAFNRYQVNRGNTVQGLQSLSGQGMSGVTTIGNQGANTAANIGSTYMNNAANIGNAGMAAAGLRNSAYGGTANVLGRMYGGRGGYNPYGGGGGAPVYDISGRNDNYNPYDRAYSDEP
jgi:hypothetical protein